VFVLVKDGTILLVSLNAIAGFVFLVCTKKAEPDGIIFVIEDGCGYARHCAQPGATGATPSVPPGILKDGDAHQG